MLGLFKPVVGLQEKVPDATPFNWKLLPRQVVRLDVVPVGTQQGRKAISSIAKSFPPSEIPIFLIAKLAVVALPENQLVSNNFHTSG